jgi:hypothetical protein
MDEVVRLYATSAAAIWLIVETGHVRGDKVEWDAVSEELPPDRSPKRARRGVDESHSDGCFMVDLGPGQLHFVYGARQGPARERSKELAKRVATAFAEGRRADLLTYFRYFRHYVPVVLDEASRLTAAIDRELATYDRIVVTLLVANAGRLPYVLSGRATLTLVLSGYVYGQRDGRSSDEEVPARGRVVERDQDAKCHIYAAREEDPDAFMRQLGTFMTGRQAVRERMGHGAWSMPRAFGVMPNSPLTVVCESDLTVAEMDVPDAIRASHSAAERLARLDLGVIRPGRRARRRHSVAVEFPFADVEHSPPPEATRPSRHRS